MTPGYFRFPIVYARPAELHGFLALMALHERMRAQHAALTPTVLVQYKCEKCSGGEWRHLTVPARASLDEPIGPWLDETRRRISIDHHERSPGCYGGEYDMQVPVENDVVGGVLKQ